MASRKASNIERALLSKGFRSADTHHRYLVFHVADKPTSIRTHVSHSRPDYGDNLLSKVQKQLHLPTKRDLLDLVDCPMSGEDYLKLLQEQGLASPRTKPK